MLAVVHSHSQCAIRVRPDLRPRLRSIPERLAATNVFSNRFSDCVRSRQANDGFLTGDQGDLPFVTSERYFAFREGSFGVPLLALHGCTTAGGHPNDFVTAEKPRASARMRAIVRLRTINDYFYRFQWWGRARIAARSAARIFPHTPVCCRARARHGCHVASYLWQKFPRS